MAKWEYKDGRTIEFESYAERQERHKRIALTLMRRARAKTFQLESLKG